MGGAGAVGELHVGRVEGGWWLTMVASERGTKAHEGGGRESATLRSASAVVLCPMRGVWTAVFIFALGAGRSVECIGAQPGKMRDRRDLVSARRPLWTLAPVGSGARRASLVDAGQGWKMKMRARCRACR